MASSDGEVADPLRPTPALLKKLGALVVHAEGLLEAGVQPHRPAAIIDLREIEALLADSDLLKWKESMGKRLPKTRPLAERNDDAERCQFTDAGGRCRWPRGHEGLHSTSTTGLPWNENHVADHVERAVKRGESRSKAYRWAASRWPIEPPDHPDRRERPNTHERPQKRLTTAEVQSLLKALQETSGKELPKKKRPRKK